MAKLDPTVTLFVAMTEQVGFACAKERQRNHRNLTVVVMEVNGGWPVAFHTLAAAAGAGKSEYQVAGISAGKPASSGLVSLF